MIPGLAGFDLGDSDINSYRVAVAPAGRSTTSSTSSLIMPLLGLTETPLPVPESISTPVLSHPAAAPAGAAAAPEKKG